MLMRRVFVIGFLLLVRFEGGLEGQFVEAPIRCHSRRNLMTSLSQYYLNVIIAAASLVLQSQLLLHLLVISLKLKHDI